LVSGLRVHPALGQESADAGELDPESPLKLGEFADYELLSEIGHGGMGVVYQARQKSLDRIVALKMLLGGQFAEPQARARFRSEAEITAQIQHPNIVAIHEVGEHDHLPFFTMDYVEGRSLGELARDKPLTPAAAAGYMASIARAIAYAHEKGVLHRDLKPSNILIDGSDQPRITDFGLAKRLTDSTTSLTLTGEALGSPNFMPPEQAAGRHADAGRRANSCPKCST
jgi:eukaryotic-like serine/threonine-protein kinase